MTTRATLSLEGFDAYLEELRKDGEDLNLVAEDGLEAGANVFVGGMRRRAPFERIRLRIRKSGMGRDGNKRYVYVGVLRGTPAEDARIAAVWEFGGRTSPSPKNSGRIPRPGIRARPFIRPSLRQDAGKAREKIEEKFQEWLKNER